MCDHEKVYSARVFYLSPICYPWICAKCGKMDEDFFEGMPIIEADGTRKEPLHFTGTKDEPRYQALKLQFHGG